MSTLRLPIDRRQIVHDARFPVAGGRDDGPLEARAALEDHMRGSMSAENYTKAHLLLNYLISALLGPDVDEGEGGAAMDARRDPQPGELAKMFPTSINPKLAPNSSDRSATNERSSNARRDAGESELSKLFPDAANPRNYR